MQEPKIIKDKRNNYLTHFKDGVIDALFYRDQYENKKSSDYYKKGYSFGNDLNKKREEENEK
jgi:hypothetical protein|tara:strand:+ start:343 stop:528 length:186 start_codon:yes stop_codon:yes gene_type:complete